MVTLIAVPVEGKSACRARKLEEYEDVWGDAKLEDYGSVEVRNGKMGCEIC